MYVLKKVPKVLVKKCFFFTGNARMWEFISTTSYVDTNSKDSEI